MDRTGGGSSNYFLPFLVTAFLAFPAAGLTAFFGATLALAGNALVAVALTETALVEGVFALALTALAVTALALVETLAAVVLAPPVFVAAVVAGAFEPLFDFLPPNAAAQPSV